MKEKTRFETLAYGSGWMWELYKDGQLILYDLDHPSEKAALAAIEQVKLAVLEICKVGPSEPFVEKKT